MLWKGIINYEITRKKVTYESELEELGLKLSVEWDKLNYFYNIQLYKNNKIIIFKLQLQVQT